MNTDITLLSPATIVRVPSDGVVVGRLIDDEVVIINFNSGVYFTVAGTGVELWPLLERGITLAALTRWAAARWTGTADHAPEMEAFCRKLLDDQLIVIAAEAVTEPAAPQPAGAPFTAPIFERHDDLAASFAIDPPLPAVKVGAKR